MSLLKAIKAGNSKKISKLLDSNSFDSKELDKSSRNNLLHACVDAGDSETLTVLIRDKQLTDLLYEMNDDDYTPVELAIENMDKPCLSILLEAGDKGIYDEYELERLGTDISDPEILKLILDKGGNINRRFTEGSLVSLALMNDQESVLEYLLGEPMMDLGIKGQNGQGVVKLCIDLENSRYLQMIIDCIISQSKKRELTAEEKEVIKFKNSEGKGILHILAEKEMKIMSEYVLKRADQLEIDTKMRDLKGRTYEDILEENRLRAIEKKEREKEEKKLRKNLKQQRKAEKEKEKKEAIQREEEMEKILKKQKIERIRQDLDNRNRNGFLFVMCLILFFVFAYLLIKFKIEYKKDYLIDSQVQIDI
jgi:hypothetical protein